MSKFNERFRILKDESKLSSKELSKQLNIAPSTLSYYLKDREPNYDILVQIADYFDVTTDWLIGRTDTRSSVYKALDEEITNAIIKNDFKEITKDDITPLSVYRDDYSKAQDKIIEFMSFYYTLLHKLEQLQELHPEHDFSSTNTSLEYNFIEGLEYQIDLLCDAQWTITASTSNVFFEYYFNSLSRINLITERYKMFLSNILKVSVSNLDVDSNTKTIIYDFIQHSENYGQNCISDTELSSYINKLGLI